MAATTGAHTPRATSTVHIGTGNKRHRRDVILALLLCLVSVLILLCLASHDPNDNSLMAAGGNANRANLVGAVGANFAAASLQVFGLISFALPAVIFLIAWQRFSRASLHAPFGRIAGAVMVMLAAAALLALSGLSPLADRSYNAGGVMGMFIASTVAAWFGIVGTAVLLAAIGSIGLLLTTDISLIQSGKPLLARRNPFDFIKSTYARFQLWNEQRRDNARERPARRRLAQEEAALSADARGHIQARAANKDLDAKQTRAERVAEFMRETDPLTPAEGRSATNAIKRAAQTEDSPALHEGATASANNADAAFDTTAPRPLVSPATIAASHPAVPSGLLDDVEIEEMVRTAAVVRTDTQDEAASVAKANARQTKSAPLDYRLPELPFLHEPAARHEQADDELLALARRVAEKCKEFNVTGNIEHICPGPVVTTYEFKPDPGVKYSRVTGLVDDLCLALKAESVRIDRVPGKAHVGIEVPNADRETIFMREVLESRLYKEATSPLTLALGKTIDGLNYVADLAKMPHLLIAGATGTGKSVCLNSLVVSILYKATPDEVNFIMIDPKRLELGLYADIPHLKHPIITDPKRAANALRWAVRQMEDRYKTLAKFGVRNIDGYNAEIARRNADEEFDEEGNPHKTIPYLVIIIDELADLMMVSGHEVEEAITRLAQMARAVGIHLILATQRPSVDVITGLIKANFPSRISFRVSSKVDSRTILDTNGAEGLLGRGDMLFLPPGTSRLIRVHGAYLDETEVARVVEHIKAQGQPPAYDETVTQSEDEATGTEGASGEHDELFDQALRICVEMKRASTSVLQRRLRIGYGRAAGILDAMEKDGLIGPADGSRPRPVLGRAFETISHWDEMATGDAEA